MSTTAIRPITAPLVAPSPSRANPFARPALPRAAVSFSRTCLLPTLPSPAKAAGDATPGSKTTAVSAAGSAGKGRSTWRLLWRGGVEIGPEGFRLEGITFFALLTFPSTPTHPIPNPFDVPISTPSHLPDPSSAHSPFSLPSADTDICLSLESMRGRKYLHIRGVTDLADSDILEGSDDPSGSGGVQMSIAPTSHLLVAYFTGLLCREAQLSLTGRTRKAVLIGLGDDDSPQNTLLVYGQLQTGSTALRLLVSRRRPPAPPPSEIKIKPGEPLPRAPLFFPAKARKPLPFPNRSTLAKSRSFSRTSSVSSIYAPPVSVTVQPIASTSGAGQANAPVSGRTPGRRGEKRPRAGTGAGAEENERKRKSGKVVMIKEEPDLPVSREMSRVPSVQAESSKMGAAADRDEDIFGTKPKVEGALDVQEASASSKKRARVPQQVLDNKALIRKQALVVMESRGYPRDHELFKDIFGMTIKGVYFVFRDNLLDGPLDKTSVQSFVSRHLDMYLPSSSTILGQTRTSIGSSVSGDGEDTAVDDESQVAVKEEEKEELEDEGINWGGGVDVGDILPVVLVEAQGTGAGTRIGDAGSVGSHRMGFARGSFSRSRSMDVVQEEDEG
ncbi:uncharacterized protein MKK02DRAFT_43683 [Dioszegia hungarica]|uniref:Sld7 C-terminal domain-containing protein n=1 Tax=Dioszegia hungarica TaxID=4972 RepID=A0AA38LRX5_9TREE|nr:uncharacterized protein MKK02DRAFT_43678 [Dioszegia hungarica]XP_052944784.1 uncharacterized protein MKK02DRAFT_43683 [Dioszegia hungarica]KAI9635002.1 hypothetical protein MKK02DRAFT_43678 [Dioszegia hungarica]KAI9635007.1 hypothetical protein MKK02DRAFT_43683 [Dioszegia hungarica]